MHACACIYALRVHASLVLEIRNRIVSKNNFYYSMYRSERAPIAQYRNEKVICQ